MTEPVESDPRWEKLEKQQLFRFADEIATEVPNRRISKKNLIKLLEQDGATYEMYEDMMSEPQENNVQDQPAELASGDDVADLTGTPDPTEGVAEEELQLIKMTRRNKTYEVRGYRFTSQHPYQLVTEEDANFLIEHGGGFRPASSKELKEYYAV